MPDETETIEQRLDRLERQNLALLADLTELRQAAEAPKPAPAKAQPPAPTAPPQYRSLPGQGNVMINAVGERMVGEVDAATTTVGGNVGFGSVWRTLPNGERIWCPDGVPRDIRSGEALATRATPLPPDAGPQRSAMHEQQIARVDAMFPIDRPPASPDD